MLASDHNLAIQNRVTEDDVQSAPLVALSPRMSMAKSGALARPLNSGHISAEHDVAFRSGASLIPTAEFVPGTDFVDNLIERNRDLWDQFVNHRFCQEMALGTGSLDGFRYYMVVSTHCCSQI